MEVVDLYTDGACSGNPGTGGWGAILKYGEHEKELSGGEYNTTNNRMELTAVIKALEALKRPCEVNLTTDSKYIVDAINKGWLYNWVNKNWIKSDKQPVANQDLWKRMLELLNIHIVHFIWVKGHSVNAYNNRCDELAVNYRKKLDS